MTVWSFPLYYYTVPGTLISLIDRQLPMALPFMEEQENQTGNGGHACRYDMSGKQTVVISTCGFYTAKGNYDGVRSLFDHTCGKGEYTAIFCGQGELFRVPELSGRTDQYLGYVRKAEREYVSGDILPDTWENLDQLLYPREIFENYKGRQQVLEMCYTDRNECYHIVMGKEVMWGLLYLMTPIWTYVLMGIGIKPYVGAVNSILPAFMEIFTQWFQKWYPAKVAEGGWIPYDKKG